MKKDKIKNNIGEKRMRDIDKSLLLGAHILDHINDSILLYDLEGNIVYANNVVCRLLGYKKETLLSKKVEQIEIIGSDEDRKARKKELLEKGRMHFRICRLQKNGKKLDGEFNSRIIEYGGKKFVLSIIQDVSETKKALERSEYDEKILSGLFNNLHEAVVVGDIIFDKKKEPVDFVPIKVNPRFRKFFYSKGPNDPFLKKISELIPEKKKDFWRNVFFKVARTGKPFKGEYYIQSIKMHIEVMIFAIAENRVAAIISDITIQERSRQEIIDEKNLAQKYLDVAGAMMVILDENGKIKLINKKGCEILGWKEKEMIGKDWFDNFVPQLYRQQVKGIFRTLKDGNEKEARNFENQVLTKKGVTRTVVWHNTNLRDEQGRFSGVLSSGIDITDKKNMEFQLETKSNLLLRTLDSTPNSITIKDRDGHFLLANRASLNLMGVPSLDKLLGKTDFDIFPKKEALEYFNEDKIVIEEGRSVFKQRKISDRQFPDKEKWFMSNKVPLLDQKGKIIGIVIITFEITKLREMEQQLATERNLLTRIIDTIPDYVYAKDAQSRFILANKACLRLVGANTFEELKGKTDADFMKDNAELAREYYEEEQKIIKTGQPLTGVEQEGLIDGEKGWMSVNKFPLYGVTGKIEGIVGVNIDITDSKNAYTELERSKQNLSNITETLVAGIFVIDSKGAIKFSNPSGEKMFQDQKEHLIQRVFKMINENPGRKEIDLLKDGRKVGIGEVFIKDIQWYGTKAHLVRILDITERKNLIDELTKKTEALVAKNLELEKMDKTKDEFLSNMSHEMRTPLTIMKEFTSILLEGLAGNVNEKQKEHLVTIYDSILNMSRIINNILDMSRIEAGRMELNMKAVKVIPMIESTANYFRAIANKKGIEMETEVAKNFPSIFADEEKILQILHNLIWNAVKFTPNRGRIKICAKESDIKIPGARGFIEISVSDTGAGLEPQDFEKIFDRFQQIKKIAGTRGTGLGLTISKELVNMHQGKIWVESEGLGKGSTFKFILPKL